MRSNFGEGEAQTRIVKLQHVYKLETILVLLLLMSLMILDYFGYYSIHPVSTFNVLLHLLED